MSTNYPIPMQHPMLDARIQDGVLTVAMGTAQAPACFDVPAIEALDQIVKQLSTDQQVRVLVFRASGAQFGQGLDPQAFEHMFADDRARVQQALHTVRRWRNGQFRQLPQPVLAVIEGDCAGAAITLVEACDIALCSDDARFMLNGEDARWLALEPEAQPSAEWLCARALSYHYLTGRSFNGQEAERMGLVTFSHPNGSLANELSQLLTSLCEKDPLALQFTKETLAHVGSMSWDAAVSFTAAKFAEIKARQADIPSARASAIAGFLAGKNKPGLGG